jgi:hypothetical protein
MRKMNPFARLLERFFIYVIHHHAAAHDGQSRSGNSTSLKTGCIHNRVIEKASDLFQMRANSAIVKFLQLAIIHRFGKGLGALGSGMQPVRSDSPALVSFSFPDSRVTA